MREPPKCERVVDLADAKRIQLLSAFENDRNANLVTSLHLNWQDRYDAIYYIVHKDSVPLFYFSLRASSLFSDKIELDAGEVNLAKRAVSLLKDNSLNLDSAEDYLRMKVLLQNSGIVTQNISHSDYANTLDRLFYIWGCANDLKSETNLAVFQKVIPCIELIEFCKCSSTASRNIWKNLNLPSKPGTYVFYTYIAPIIEKIGNDIGCSTLVLYAADNTHNKALIRNYIEELHMRYPENIMTVKPAYDVNCTLLIQHIDSIVKYKSLFSNLLSDSEIGTCSSHFVSDCDYETHHFPSNLSY